MNRAPPIAARPAPRQRARRAATMLAALALAPAAVTAAAEPMVVLDRQLRAVTGEIRRITPQSIVLAPFPLGEPDRTFALADVAIITRPGWWSPEPSQAEPDARAAQADPRAAVASAATIELTDGRVLRGTLALDDAASAAPANTPQPADKPAGTVAWMHPILGRLTFPLDAVRSIRLPGGEGSEPGTDEKPARSPAEPAPDPRDPKPGTPARAEPTRDAVLLNNGDRVTGFVEQVAAEVWIADGQAMTKVPVARVQEVRLVNPVTRPAGTRVWLDGASAVGVDYLGADPQRGLTLGIEPAPGKSRQVFVRPEQVRAIVPEAERLTPLAALPVAKVSPQADRPFVEPPRAGRTDPLLGAADVELPGPMSVEWTLPAGAERLGGWIVLPPAYHEWGDCTVRIETLGAAGPSEVGRESVSAARALVPINVPLPAGTRALRITVDAGAYGPIQDRIVLRRMLVVSAGDAKK